MNNTQNPDSSGLSCADDNSSINSSERRPKPIRGVGYGDIFASGGTKPSPPDSTRHLARERLGPGIASILQKQIPRKLPPPAPTSLDNDANSTVEAPKLPPKPTPGGNHFSSLMQSSLPLMPATQQQQQQSSQKLREQARVIYEYEPMNQDELAMKPGDIIDILDKEIEDVGWWKGELNGKIGVFPDNFVQLIEVPEMVDEQQTLRDGASMNSNQAIVNSSHSNEGKIKSVFAATPKGFSKELENNLEKHGGSPASFLSLKRTKLQQQISAAAAGSTGEATMTPTIENDKIRGDSIGSLETSITKLNHITANRAKGPTRRPPSSILSKRNQLDQVKRESNGRDDLSLGSLPINTTTQSAAHDLLSSLPAGQHTTSTISTFSSKPDNGISLNPIKPSLSLDNVIDNLPSTPKTSQRANHPSVASDKSKTVDTPAWMVQLKKTQGQKKRESPTVNATPVKEPVKEPIREPVRESLKESVKEPVKEPVKVEAPNQPSVNSELSELREDVKRLKEDFLSLNELREIVEVMRKELKACQSATENQRRYIKELVNNLADERKKIASMQIEIDRNLK